MAGLCTLVLPLAAVSATDAGAAAAAGTGITVRAGALAVTVGQQGGIASVAFADGSSWPISGQSQLSDGSTAETCQAVGDAYPVAHGGAAWRTQCTAGSTVTNLTDTLTPAGSSVSWTLRVTSVSGIYSQDITTALSGFSDGNAHEFWTTWGQSSAAAGSSFSAWANPLQLEPFTNMTLNYGGNAPAGQNGLSVPVFTIAEPATDNSLSLVQSPADVLLNGNLTTTTSGAVSWTRSNNEISPDRPVTFHMNLVGGPSDWRTGLGWMAKQYPRYFDSAIPAAGQLAGLGTYSAYPGPFSASLTSRLRSIDYKTNWELSTRGPYIGESLPPVSSDSQTWPSFIDKNVDADNGSPTESVNSLRTIESNYTDTGFNVLAYFNTTEFGDGEAIPAQPPADLDCSQANIWADATAYAYCDFPNAILRNSAGSIGTGGGAYGGGLLVDPGDPAYANHLVSQARNLLTAVPQYAGINIDRTDRLTQFNTNASDGVSFSGGQPVRSLITSWKELMPKLEGAVHALGKQVWVSPTSAKRVDWYKGVDGIFSEFNSDDAAMNEDAFMGLGRPVLGWNDSLTGASEVQQYLYMGADPMSDRPYNDHGLPIAGAPNFGDDDLYQQYAPMFQALQGRQWLLTPDAVSVTGSSALANAFTTKEGVVIPVVLGGQSDQATLTLSNLRAAMPGLVTSHAQYLLPGTSSWQTVPAATSAGRTQVTVPLASGAVMVRFGVSKAVTDPARAALAVNLTSASQAVSATAPQTVTATAANQTASPARMTASLHVPAGWHAVVVSKPRGAVAPGAQGVFQWSLTSGPSADGTVGTISARVGYQAGTSSGSATAQLQLAAGTPVPEQQITATASSAEDGNPPSSAVDGDEQTFWHSEFSPTYNGLPQSITLDLGQTYNLAGLTYLPRQDGAIQGQIGGYTVYVSTDGTNFTEVTSGTWSADDMGLRAATFAATARYVRLEADTGWGATWPDGLASAAQIGVLQPSSS